MQQAQQFQNQLQESEARFRQIADFVPQLIWVWRADQSLEYVNQRWIDYTGLSLAETAQQPILPTLFHAEDQAELVRRWAISQASGEDFVIDARLQNADGAFCWFLVRIASLRNDQGHILKWFGACTDIHEQKLGEIGTRFLADITAYLGMSVKADRVVADVLNMVAIAFQACHCYLAEINEATDRWIVRQEMQNPLFSLIGEHPLSPVASTIRQTLANGQSIVIHDTSTDPLSADEYATIYAPIQMRAQIVIPLLRNGRWVAALTIATNVARNWQWREVSLLETIAEHTWNTSEKLHLEASQREYVARLQYLNEASLQINTTSTKETLLQQIAHQARAVIGTELAVVNLVPDGNWATTQTATSFSAAYSAWQNHSAPRTGERIYQQVVTTKRTLRLTQAELEAHPTWRGNNQPAQHAPLNGLLVVPLNDSRGNCIGLILLSAKNSGLFTLADEALLLQLAQIASVALANQSLYEQEQAARIQVEETSRFKDEFLATISHELRTPLTAFLGYAQLLQTRKRDQKYLASTLEKMINNAKMQAQLIDDLLDVSRIVSGNLLIKPTLIDFHAVIRAALDTVEPAIEARKLKLIIDLQPNTDAIMGDAKRLQQIVWNLLSNAIKFSFLEAQISIQLAQQNGHVQLTVRDEGVGIDPAFLPYVFDRFRQADGSSTRRHGGLGLGLAIVRHLVELHGGSVTASSAGVGQGATFIVSLPLPVS